MRKSARSTWLWLLLLLALGMAFPLGGRAQVVSGTVAEGVEAPNVTGMAAQGISVDLGYFRGDKNVLLVFYRMYN